MYVVPVWYQVVPVRTAVHVEEHIRIRPLAVRGALASKWDKSSAVVVADVEDELVFAIVDATRLAAYLSTGFEETRLTGPSRGDTDLFRFHNGVLVDLVA